MTCVPPRVSLSDWSTHFPRCSNVGDWRLSAESLWAETSIAKNHLAQGDNPSCPSAGCYKKSTIDFVTYTRDIYFSLSKIQGTADLVLSKSSILGWQMATFSYCSHTWLKERAILFPPLSIRALIPPWGLYPSFPHWNRITSQRPTSKYHCIGD